MWFWRPCMVSNSKKNIHCDTMTMVVTAPDVAVLLEERSPVVEDVFSAQPRRRGPEPRP